MRGIISIAIVTLFVFSSIVSARSHSDHESRSLGRPRSLSRSKSGVLTRSIGRSRASIRSLSLRRSRARLLKRKSKSAADSSPDAFKCVLNIYKQSYVTLSKEKACKYISDGKQTKGISRWPETYNPPNPDQFAFRSNTFQLWPLQKDGEVFDGSKLNLY